MFLTKGSPFRLLRHFSGSLKCCQETQHIDLPVSDSEPLVVSPKIENIVNEIAKLTLIEVSELNTAIKKKLNLPDVPLMAVGASAAAIPVAEVDVAPKVAKSNYTVKLIKFEDGKKVALIKEIKGMMEDMNLVQAKKFVESAPVVLKADISKEEADKLKETLEKIGAEISIH